MSGPRRAGSERAGPRAHWLAARARNTLRRPSRIIGVSVTAFLVTLFALVLIPRHATRTARLLLQGTNDRPDTAALANRVAHARSMATGADLALTRARNRARERLLHPPVVDTLGRGLATRRDSLAAEEAELGRLITRAEAAPLSASYRALADAAVMRGDTRVRSLRDSLSDVERARDAFNAEGGVDPIFVALTSRVNAIGRSLVGVAETKRAALRTHLSALGGPSAAVQMATIDTVRPLARADSLRQVLGAAVATLDSARRVDSVLDARTERAREIANVSAPPLALVGAALVLGAVVGFAVTFGMEVREPHVSDGAEAARVAGVPTLAVIARRPPVAPDRMRRSTDRAISPLVDVNAPAYRGAYLAWMAGVAPGALPMVAVTGDEPDVVATIAANLAVAAAYDSRSTLLVDADHRAGMAAAILGVSRATDPVDAPPPRTATIGRNRALDVIFATATRDDLERLARRYDAIIVSAPALEQPNPFPSRDVLLCVRVAYTTLTRVAESAAALSPLRGLVLWAR